LDRSPAAFARQKGWSAGLGKSGDKGRAEQIKKGEKTAFEVSLAGRVLLWRLLIDLQVFVPAKDDASDGLAKMFGGDEEKEEI
jgi:ATP-dependent DNA helicase